MLHQSDEAKLGSFRQVLAARDTGMRVAKRFLYHSVSDGQDTATYASFDSPFEQYKKQFMLAVHQAFRFSCLQKMNAGQLCFTKEKVIGIPQNPAGLSVQVFSALEHE